MFEDNEKKDIQNESGEINEASVNDEVKEAVEETAEKITQEVETQAGEAVAQAAEAVETKVEEAQAVAEAKAEAAVEEVNAKVEETVAQATEATEPKSEAVNSEAEEKPSKENKIKNFFKKPVAIALSIAGVLIVLIIVAAVALGSGSGFDGKLRKLSPKAVASAGEFIYNIKAETRKLSDDLNSVANNIDQSAIVCQRRDGTDVEIWYVDGSLEPKKINAAQSISRITIADDGKYVMYVIDEVSGTNDGADIYIYNVAKEENTVVAKDVVTSSVVASSDCKSVAYVANYESNSDNDMFVAVLGKDPVKIAKDGCYPISVVNGGKKLFYANKNENKLYYYNGKEAEKIASDVNTGSFYVNNDASELVYFKDSKTYWYKAGSKEANKIYSKAVNYFICSRHRWPSDTTMRLVADTFADVVFVDYDCNILKINNKIDDVDKITSNYDHYAMSIDGKELLYADDDELYYVNLSKSIEPTMILETEDIEDIVANSDLSKIFIVNDDDELIYVTKTGKHETITNDISTDYRALVCESSGKVYFIEDGDLYEATRNKKSKTKIESDVVSLQYSLGGILYKTEDEKIGLIF